MQKLRINKKKQELSENLPKSISIFGEIFTVQVTNLKGLHGDCQVASRIIRIHQNQDIEAARSTLFHECIHAALGVSGVNEILDEKTEEAICRCIETALYKIVEFK